MPLKWIVSVFLVSSFAGAVTLRREFDINSDFAVCGEQVIIVCTANLTNFFTLSVNGFGSHTFERNSKKQATLGPFNLNLTRADIDPNIFFLTVFEVTITPSQEYFVELPRINCSDAQSSDSLSVEIKSENCSQEMAEATSSNEILLQWIHPTCPGWNNLISLYSIHIYKNEAGVPQVYSNSTEYLVTNASSVTNVSITATNFCMETTVIKTYVIVAQSKEEDNTTRGHSKEIEIGDGLTIGISLISFVFTFICTTTLAAVFVWIWKRQKKNAACQMEKGGGKVKESTSKDDPDSDTFSVGSDQNVCLIWKNSTGEDTSVISNQM